ncbi:MAG TPA: fibronectin type III domain-containing protein, partial [Candidatus Syntrophosphaera sp.]|nr:fibronectin type III domain-containing protein [Candidatus Syntrophosphaera sp.]
MRLTLCLAALFTLAASLTAVVTEVASLRGFLHGSEPGCAYDNWISHVAEGRVSYLNVYAPWEEQNNDFGDFRIATQQELADWGRVINAFLALDLDDAEARIQQYGFPYQVVQFQDLDSGRNVYMLRETLNEDIDDNDTPDPGDDETGSFEWGWGLYIYDPYASRPILITAPHPCDDYPSPVFALESFYRLDARFLMIAGAGREVAYFPPYNSNNQSISDPSRMDAHPFNIAYQAAADQIRGLTGRTEFSLQIHSYDWNKYPGQPNVMFSTGNGRFSPALPLRDNSRVRHDLINHTPFLIHPQNSLGTHSEVDILDYYCVYHDTDDPVLYEHDGQSVTIADNTELPGAIYNQQMLYTEQQNLFDVYSPFLHVEMDELPKCYERTEANWHWFYGYDAVSQSWDQAQRFTRFIQFYTPWLNALCAVVDSMLALDDGTGPSNPANLRVTYAGTNYNAIAWERSYAYDFDSYLITLRWEEEGIWIEQTYDRHTHPDLAWQSKSSFQLDLPNLNRVYYVRIRARDKHGNASPFSNEVKIWKFNAGIANFNAVEGDNVVYLSFTTYGQAVPGYNIYRCVDGGAFTLLAGWTENPALQYNEGGYYAYQDITAANGIVYGFQVSAELTDGSELFHWSAPRVCPYRKYALTLLNQQSGQTAIAWIGTNPLASEGRDAYDLKVNVGSQALLLGTLIAAGDSVRYQDIRQPFDPLTTAKTWVFGYRCTQTGVTLQLTPDPLWMQEGNAILLYDATRDRWHDLSLGPYVWLNDSIQWQELRLVWGRQAPRTEFPAADDLFQFPGAVLDLQWQVLNRPRVLAVDLWLSGPVDSLLIASGISPVFTQLPYTPPRPVSAARLAIRLHCDDGSQSVFLSRRRYSVLPPNLAYEQAPGFALLSFPLGGFNQSVTEMLGPPGAAYTLQPGGGWEACSSVQSGSGYLLYHPQSYQLLLPTELPAAAVTQILNPGWNLLANPFCHHLELRDLYSASGANQRDFAALVADSLLFPRVILQTHSGLVLASALPPGQAALIHNSGTEPLPLVLDPWFHAGQAIPWSAIWSVSLSVSDGYNSGDQVQLGVAETGSADLDFSLDLPKPQAFPEALYRLSLPLVDPQSGATLERQSSFRELYPWYDPVAKTWAFCLTVNDLRPLRLTLSAASLPSDYSVELNF